jgi:hypothetical protein
VVHQPETFRLQVTLPQQTRPDLCSGLGYDSYVTHWAQPIE